MRKELYATADNIRDKGIQWVASLERRRRWEGTAKNPALLILDMQKYFLDEGSHAFIPTAPAIVDVINEIASGFRGPVIATRHVKDPDEGNLMNVWWRDRPEDRSTDIVEQLKGTASLVLEKKRYSAFHGTGLEGILKKGGVDSVIITGVHTDLCCETTARDAFMRGLRVYLIADATATSTEERHTAALNILSIGFGEVLTSTGSGSLW